MDVMLTDYGRQLLSENRLNFTYFAFSDDGIDYSGSISKKMFTGSIDDIVFRNFSFEEKQLPNGDLSYFLYTIPAKSEKIPEFVLTPNSASAITLERTYYTQNFSLHNSNLNFNSKPLDLIFIGTADSDSRESDYVKYQNFNNILSRSQFVLMLGDAYVKE